MTEEYDVSVGHNKKWVSKDSKVLVPEGKSAEWIGYEREIRMMMEGMGRSKGEC